MFATSHHIECALLELVERPALRLPGERGRRCLVQHVHRRFVVGQEADQLDTVNNP
ncbi:hypothetical protein FRUB_06905 [Fimbriiglobus ruber]|uniref:Uncharacterized protein n=1 Tax=Fimbriiglobus ruber TaxID=1908690 RepID=A0A225DN04_9BACT|nr:hypothetical protein FRUB_06905 [Fimbriiglobus ruber]